ncbi:MAG: hypothetical protein LBQ12_05555 [Deltaproteobacteria bacterium]|jgi:hypothetical protein|nr:hypothetical protein [Deltaproteobacteria bacterium]
MGRALEAMRGHVEAVLAGGDPDPDAHLLDGVRAVARLVYGPGDPRVWGAMSRSARALLECGRRNSEHALRAAAAMAAGASAGFAEVRRAGAGAGGADLAVEAAFAESTLSAALGRMPPDAQGAVPSPPAPCRGLYDAYYPMPQTLPDAAPARYHAAYAGLLRARLAGFDAGEGGSGSREALAARSMLGEAIADACVSDGLGGEDRRKAMAEAGWLLGEASKGLDWLAGRGDPDSLDAKCRFARFVAGESGPARILPQRGEKFAPEGDLKLALTLYREVMDASAQAVASLDWFRYAAFRAAALSRALGDHGSADDLFVRLFAKMGGAGSPGREFAQTAMNGKFLLGFAEVLWAQGESRCAIEFANPGMASLQKNLGARHGEAVRGLALIGRIAGGSGDHESSVSFLSSAADFLEDPAAGDDPVLAELEMEIALELMGMRDPETALRLVGRSAARAAGTGGGAVPLRAKVRELSARALGMGGDYAPSSDALLAALAIFDGKLANSIPYATAKSGHGLREALLDLSFRGLLAAAEQAGDLEWASAARVLAEESGRQMDERRAGD